MNLALEERKDPGLWVGGAEGLADVGEWRGPSMAGLAQYRDAERMGEVVCQGMRCRVPALRFGGWAEAAPGGVLHPV